jgi:hypothetical protein
MLAIGLVVGILIGRYGPKLWQWLKDKMAKSDQGAADLGDSTSIKEPDPTELDLSDGVAPFMDFDLNPGIDDNPQLFFNPIMEYRIKQSKEEERLRKRQAQLLLEAEEAGVEGELTVTKQNSLALLIAAGARFEPVSAGKDDQMKEARRKVKNIETFLNKHMDIDVKPVQKQAKSKEMNNKSTVTVYEKAMETAYKRHGGLMSERAVKSAQASRNQLRDFHRRNPNFIPEPTRHPEDELQEEADEELARRGRISKVDRRGGGVNASDLSALRAEFGGAAAANGVNPEDLAQIQAEFEEEEDQDAD